MNIATLSITFTLVITFLKLGLASIVLNRIRIFDHFGAPDDFNSHISGPPSGEFDSSNLPRL
jgi:hypothetical protein